MASAAVAFHFLHDARPNAESDVHARPGPSAEFSKEYAQIQTAEAITDKLQRCLAYPNPPEFHWNPKVVEAFCRLSLRSMISWDELSDALANNHPEILDQAFSAYLEKTYQENQHGFLIWTYWWMFSGPSTKVEDVTKRWVTIDPNSPFARAARGEYLLAAAWQARGEKFARDTSEDNFARAHALAAEAKQEFDEAIDRSPRMIEAYYGNMRIARLTSDHALFDESVQKAIALDPADKWIYDEWMSASEPKWGGSIPQMIELSLRAAQHAKENPMLELLGASPYCTAAEQSACPECKDGKRSYRTALDWYRKALLAGPAPCALNRAGDFADWIGGDEESVIRYDMQAYRFTGDTEKLLRSSQALQRLGKTDWALQSVDKLLKQWPKYVKAMLYRGWILESAHRATEAEHVFRGVLQIDPQNREANTELVGLYTGVLHQRASAEDIVEHLMKANPNNPRIWLLEAALDKDGSVKQCKYDLEQYLSLVDTTTADDYEQRDIGRAKARLAELKRVRIN